MKAPDFTGLVLRGSVLRAVLLFANIAAGFYLMPFVIHAIGDRWYGMWVLVATIMGYYGYFDFGLSIAAQRFIASAIGRKNADELNRLITTMLAVFVVIGLLALLITLLIALVTPWFIADESEVRIFRIVLFILGVNTALTFSAAAFNGVLTGYLRYDISSVIHLTRLLLRTGLIIYFIGAGYSIIALATITLVADSGSNIVKVLVARKMFPDWKIGKRFYSKGSLAELFAYGGKTFVTQIADMMRFHLDHVVVAAFISLSAVTLFNIAATLVYYFRRLLEALLSVLIPVYARLLAEEDRKGIAQTYYFTSKLAVAISILVGGAAVIFGEKFLVLWMGEEYGNAYPLLIVLILPTMLFMAQQPGMALIYGLGEVGALAKVSIIEAIGNLVLSVILVQFYGLLGVALGTAIPLTLFSLFLITFSNRLIGATWLAYLQRLVPIMSIAVGLQMLAWLVISHMEISSYMDIILLFFAVYPAASAVLLLIAFSPDELRTMKEVSRRALGLG
jgi:O-antigen/teichoic acid export membrane protein